MLRYLDNAATAHPKPEEVYAAADIALRAGGSAGRSAHRLAIAASTMMLEARLAVAQLLGANTSAPVRPERVIFTPGCTTSINIVLKGIDWQPGDVVLVSALEHNAVMRPLAQLASRCGVIVETVPYSPGEILSAAELKRMCASLKPRLCVFLEASNVTGEMLDLPAVAAVCQKARVQLLLDAAQSAGAHAQPLAEGVSYWCASGHKGLLGSAGVGVLWLSEGVELTPLVSGGTGSNSDSLVMPAAYPDHLEAGTAPAPAIASLMAGVKWLQNQNLKQIAGRELALVERFMSWARNHKSVEVFGQEAKRRTAVVSFRLEGKDSALVAELLDRDFGICVRPGLHCAVAAHRTLGTEETGLVRASFGPFNQNDDVEALCKALDKISRLN